MEQQNNDYMFCTKCGTKLEKTAFFCNSCGAPTANAPNEESQTPNFSAPDYTYAPQFDCASVDRNISKSEFVKKYAPKSVRNGITAAAIIGYICAGLTAVVSLVSNPLGLVDALAFLGLMLGVHLGKNLPCAIIALALSVFEVVVALVALGSPSGWLWIVAGVLAVVNTAKAGSLYRQFRAGASINGIPDFNQNNFR